MSNKKNKDIVTVLIILTAKGNGMLQNPMTDDTLDQLIGLTSKKPVDKDRPASEIAESRVLRDEKNRAGIKIEYLTACLAEAGRNVKIGKKQISTATSTTIFGFLDFMGATFLPFSKGTDEYSIDKRRGVLNNGGKSVAVGIVRPLFKKWEIQLKIELNTSSEDGCGIENAKKLFEIAGTRVGLGDFRPAKKGPFGMFSVTKFEVVD